MQVATQLTLLGSAKHNLPVEDIHLLPLEIPIYGIDVADLLLSRIGDRFDQVRVLDGLLCATEPH